MSAVLRASRTPLIWSERIAPPRRQHLEDDLQRACCAFLTAALPPDAVFYCVPNGGMRSKKEAARMSGLGLRSGIPDLAIVFRGRALFVELKTAKGIMSSAQRDMAKRLHFAGAAVMLCRSVPQLEAQLRESCVPLRASVMA